MAYGGGYSFLPFVIQSHDPTIVQGQLQRTGTLLFGHPTTYATVYLVREPILCSNCLQLQYLVQIIMEVFQGIGWGLIFSCYRSILHYRLWRTPEHIGKIQVHWTFSRCWGFKGKPLISRNITNLVPRGS